MGARKLIIDGQIFQTDASDRGMGRYSARLIEALQTQSEYESIYIILSKNLDIKGARAKDMQKIFPNTQVIYLNLLNTSRTKIENAFAHNKKELNKCVARLFDGETEIDYIIPSLFQEPIVAVFPDNVRKSLIFYDLIPYLYHDRYESLMRFELYLKRFKVLFEADKILTISQAVKDDLVVYLGLPATHIDSIDGAAIRALHKPEKPAGFSENDTYILMTTSDDPRKNNFRAVLAFEEFRRFTGSEHKLVITSKIHKREQTRLGAISPNIIFTGNVGEPQLDWLYENCEALLFVPESEGLGLPILEAVEANKKVICSSISVFREISETAFYYCEYDNVYSIEQALTAALVKDTRKIDAEEYQRILKHYTWERTAERAINALSTIEKHHEIKRPRVALFIPRPDGLSAVGKVAAEGYPVMREYFDIDYYAEDGLYDQSARPNYLQYVAPYYPAESFCVDRYRMYDAVFYHVGNSDYHIQAIKNASYLPGYVILHDTNISEAYRIMQEQGLISADRRALQTALTDKSDSTMSQDIMAVVNDQLGVITHSSYARKAVGEVSVGKNALVANTNLATNCATYSRSREYSDLVVGLAGIIADIKGIEVIELLASDDQFSDCRFSLFGYNYASQEVIDRLKSYPNISVETNLTDFEFQNNIGKLDVFINYRMKYQGETSLSTIEAMRQGVVVIVRDVGWYSELPDEAVVKVNSVEEVLHVLRQLQNNPEHLREIAARAKAYICEYHTYDRYSKALLGLIEGGQNLETASIQKELRGGNVRKFTELQSLYRAKEG